MTFDVVADDRCKALVARCAPLGDSGFTDNDRGIRISSGGKTAAALVFSDYRPARGSIELSAIWRPGFPLQFDLLSTEIVSQIGEYAFRQLRLNRVFARTSHKNARAIHLLERIGFTPEGTSADFYGMGHSARNYRMLKREWEAKYGLLKEAA